MAMPPRTLATQHVIDSIYTAPGPTAAAAADDEVERLDFATALRRFNVQSATQLSPIQSVWQQGEFIRLALEAGQLPLAIRVATAFVGALTNTGAEAAIFARPGSSLFLDAYGDNQMSAVALRGADALLFLAYYAPLCPDLGASLALLKQVVHTVGHQISPLWISTILQADDYQFYVSKFTPNFSNWFHVMRRDHTLAAAAWLLGPEQPLPVQIAMNAAMNGIHTILALEHAPSATRDLMLNAILHTQARSVILQVDAAIVRGWLIGDERTRAIATIDHHLAMHAPPTEGDVVSVRQERVMDDLVEQMTRTATSDVPFDIAGLVMDYVRRDESTPGAGSKLTPYKQAENEHIRRRTGWVQMDMAAEQVAAARARSTPAAAHPRPDASAGDEEEKQAQHARLHARFRFSSFPAPVPMAHW